MTTTFAWVAAIFLLPFALLFVLTESRQQRAVGLRRSGWSYKRIAVALNCSPTTARRLVTQAL